MVVSYNILGVENASKHLDLYSNIPRRFLEWNRRKSLIRDEIYNYNADILCFQVVYYDSLFCMACRICLNFNISLSTGGLRKLKMELTDISIVVLSSLSFILRSLSLLMHGRIGYD